MSRVDQKLAFDKWADAFKIEGDRRDRLWSIMLANSLTPDDVNVYFLGAAGVLEKVADQVEASTGSLPERIEAAAQRAVGPIAKAASKEVEASHAKLVASTGEKVAASATAYLDQELTRRRFTVSGVVASIIVLLCLAVGWLGYSMGTRTSVSNDARVASIASRSDVRTVLGILDANPNLAATISTWCGSGTGRVTVVEGVRSCAVPLWIDGRSAAPAGASVAGPLVSMWNAGASFLNGWSSLTIAFVFLVLGVLLRKIILTAGKLPGAKWLTT